MIYNIVDIKNVSVKNSSDLIKQATGQESNRSTGQQIA